MSRILSLLAVLCLLSVSLGCGSKSDSSGAGGGPVPSDPVARTVYEFLDAIRTGDTQASSARLTSLALQRITENDMIFAPPASELARFQVGQIQMYAADKAFVESIWTDIDADGVPTDEHMTWALKLTESQWRISGMAAQLGPGQPPVLMDFENPGQLLNPPQQKTAAGQQPQPAPEASPRQASQPTQDPFH
jgi:hypothetical protein